ncbi:MAG TPA: gliding motility-associated ABC transporter ATP-binding subunit GldA [Bacteroidales bacterium]|nr:gliding motility-associated ABC transporter ATP-binding subunit GldA [Bacteroidales bacterium]HPS16516.1 gliding motility-associated ABC transporter ATP-binding subunit GldA [Bacteroidales bacterium]
MSIKVDNITKLYGEQKALDNVSFKIDAGEIVGLVGPNGAGKSTMMKIITCYLPQTSGTASVCGFDVVENPIEVKRKVGYLPEHNPLYLDMYIREYLEFIAGIHKMGKKSKERVSEMINLTGLDVEKGKKIGALSKGYRQRVGLAQALIHEPEVLILDEPTSGLDPNQIIDIRNLIKKIGKAKTVLFSTHIMQEVEAICDKVIVIDKGKIVANKTTVEMHKINEDYVSISIELGSPVNKSLLKEIPGIIEVININSNIWNVKANKEPDIRPEIFKFAVKHNITVLSMKEEEQSLEETFQKLTKNKS